MTIHFLFHPLNGNDDQLYERFRDIGDKINKHGNFTPPVFENLRSPVKDMVFGPNHIGILLEDGRAFRVHYSINSDRLEFNRTEVSTKGDNGHHAHLNTSQKNNLGVSSRQIGRSRSRIVRSTIRTASSQNSGARSTGVIIAGTSTGRPLVTVPPPFVPEELIAQAEVVLQGKSRSLIIRELQRTNLDVNLAVNNLLSRDDEDGDDADDNGDNYVPEDLISLLDNGFHADNSVIIDPTDGLFSEEIFSNYSSIRNRIRSDRGIQPNSSNTEVSSNANAKTTTTSSSLNNSVASTSTSTVSTERDAFSRWRDRQCYGSKRWLTSRDESHWEKDNDNKKKDAFSNSPLWISDELQPWPGKDVRFSKIASLFSEFVGVSVTGELHQWKWNETEAFKCEVTNTFHPKTSTLALHEKVVNISANIIRCSVSTENNQVATWYDESLGVVVSKMDQIATTFAEFSVDPIFSLHSCPLYTVARTESNTIYWWGINPFEQRKQIWEKHQNKTKKNSKFNSDEIGIGSQVIMKKCPIFQSGSIGFIISGGIPKIGQLLNSAWDFEDICHFKIIHSAFPLPEKNISEKDSYSPYSNLSKGSGNIQNKETTDRIDMPPPPSPASSTCSDTGSASSTKRVKRLATRDENDDRKDEELWPIKDVVFVEDKSGPIGKVLKVDGDYIAVRFPSLNCQLMEDDWQNCRLLKLDDIQLVRNQMSSKISEIFQRTPKKISLSTEISNMQLLSLCVDFKGVHTVTKTANKIYYSIYNLHQCKMEFSRLIPSDGTTFIGQAIHNINLTSLNEQNENNLVILRDGNKNICPIAKDCIDSIREPFYLDLPPIKGMSTTLISLPSDVKSKFCLISIITDIQAIIPAVMRCDMKTSAMILGNLEKDVNLLQLVINEKCDGSRNILHVAISMCAPTSNKDLEDKIYDKTITNRTHTTLTTASANSDTANQSNESSRVSLREMMNRLINVVDQDNNTRFSNENENNSTNSYWSGNVDSQSKEPNSIPEYISDATIRKENAISILKMICDSNAMRGNLQQLLTEKDSQGQTPFMLAVSNRAYEAAIIIFNIIQKRYSNDQTLKDLMVFPNGSSSDQCPLHVLCYNDTCSFTWTGADHINQNIFECKTCGLTGTLCCCTECARVCHKGHDCKLKRTSPTAYCDCWEKCRCKALIAGNQNSRFDLLCKLISNTDLAAKCNSRGESILLFLIQTVGRQMVEQRQYRANSRLRNNSNGTSRKSSSIDMDQDMPEHDLEPPRFARRALERLLWDWPAVKSMILIGCEVGENKFSNENDIPLKFQSSTTLLDKFTHNLFVKCNMEHLDILLSTLVKALTNSIEDKFQNAELVVNRFLRSVCRVFVIFNLEKAPNPDKKKGSIAASKHIQSCLRVFQTLHKLAILELCDTADALITPVRLGVVRPTAPFAMSSSNLDNSEDIFSVEPLAPSLDNAFQNNTDTASPPNYGISMNYGLISVEDNHTIESNTENSQEILENVNENTTRMNTEDESENLRNSELIHDEESDNEYNFNEGDTESDSDDNQSNQEGQRNEQTGATTGSDAGATMFLYQDESGDSSPPEEEGSDEGETDENSDEVYFGEEQLERRNSNVNQRSNNAPQSMQWAIRNRDHVRSSVRIPTGSNLVFIDPMALRRPSTTNAAVTTSTSETNTMCTTASSLARAFGVLLREISMLFNVIKQQSSFPPDPLNINVTINEVTELQKIVEMKLKPTWDWMFAVMDSTEAQLKFGAQLTNSTDPTHPLHPLNSQNSSQNIPSSPHLHAIRRDFFTYCLSLMRGHTSEHRDSLPVLDITALRHVAYVLDSLIFYMRDINEQKYEIEVLEKKNDYTPSTSKPLYCDNLYRSDKFFQRTDSTLSLGCTSPDVFQINLETALPLADKPHLLQPNSKRDDLFFNIPLPITMGQHYKAIDQKSLLQVPPIYLGLSATFNKIAKNTVQSDKDSPVDTINSIYNEQLKSNCKNLDFINKSVIVNPKNNENEVYPRGYFFKDVFSDPPTWNLLLGRWKLALDLFGRVFIEDVGLEQNSILAELRGFPVKETRFRRFMEKLRNSQQRDLNLSKIERNRDSLILQTFKELNTQFGNNNKRNTIPALTFNRVKVTFKDEPGEGTGVARSFYTSIAEALLSNENIPNLESAQVGVSTKYVVPFSSILRNRTGNRELTTSNTTRRGTGNKVLWRTAKDKKGLSYDAPPFQPSADMPNSSLNNSNEHLTMNLQQLGDKLYPKILALNSTFATKITGMLLELQPAQLLMILSSDEALKQKISEALDLINLKQKNETVDIPSKIIPMLDQVTLEDNAPLFYCPGKCGFYSPRQNYGSLERLNAFRNIGRLIGICLLQNELLPLSLQRSVLKYILGRDIHFHDLAFFDPIMYESLRQLISEALSEGGNEALLKLELFFAIDLCKEEGGKNVELLPGGKNIQVSVNNIYDYVREYSFYRMVKSQEKTLEAIRDGVYDVIPDGSLDYLTSEDLRLLLNGVGDISVSTLISYTTFNDESKELSDKLTKFKRWFWSIIEKMSPYERQDLIYFWTGSPALPASEEGFQPLPTVTIRPADDAHLPTANTCISRLYIPIYSSKNILKNKLLLAIKSKNFGFV